MKDNVRATSFYIEKLHKLGQFTALTGAVNCPNYTLFPKHVDAALYRAYAFYIDTEFYLDNEFYIDADYVEMRNYMEMQN